MNRRRFLLSSSSTVGAIISISKLSRVSRSEISVQKLAVNPIESSRVSSDELIIPFENLEFSYKNIESTDKPISIKIYAENTDNSELIKSYNINISQNSGTVSLNSLSLNLSNSNLNFSNVRSASARIEFSHPDTGSIVEKRKIITELSKFNDTFQNGNIDSFWNTNTPSTTSISETTSYIELKNSDEMIPTLYSSSIFEDNLDYQLEFTSKCGSTGQIRINPLMDNTFNATYGEPINRIFFVLKNYGGGDLNKVENGSFTNIIQNDNYTAPTSFHNYRLTLKGSLNDLDIMLKDLTDDVDIVSVNGISFSPSNNTPYFGLASRERKGNAFYKNLKFTRNV